MESKRFTLNKADWVGFGKRTLQTLAPYLVALIPVLISKVPASWEYAVLTVWVLNRVYDLLRRFISGK